MIRSQSGARPALPILALLILVLVAAACAPATAPIGQAGTPESTGQTVAPATVPAVAAPAGGAPAAAPAVDPADLPVGVDAEGNFYRGDPDAAVKLVEFSEFECPYCARHVMETEPQVRDTYIATGQVVHTFRHFPLDFHANAMPAAMATYCAGQQDPKLFWELHDWLFENQAAWTGATDGAAQFRTQAVALGAVEAEYDLCVADPASLARIEQDLQEGMTRGVQGTPAFFINEWFISGAYPFSEFQDKIEKAKAGQVPPPTPTPLPQGVEFFQPDPGRAGRTYDGSYYVGDPDAPIVILAFEDFKSPETAEHVKSVEAKLKTDYIDKGEVRYVVQLFPVVAPRAAVAALCAGQQANFFEFRTLLLTNLDQWTEGDDAAMQGYAADLKLDEAAFASCLADETVQTQVEQALAFGSSNIGVPQAPSYLIIKVDETGKSQDVRGFPGALPIDQFEQNIRELQAPPTPTPTPAPSISRAELASLPMGRDAEGNFYRGDPNALVKLEDYSDFQ